MLRIHIHTTDLRGKSYFSIDYVCASLSLRSSNILIPRLAHHPVFFALISCSDYTERFRLFFSLYSAKLNPNLLSGPEEAGSAPALGLSVFIALCSGYNKSARLGYLFHIEEENRLHSVASILREIL